jgi:hypothetical protein
MSVFKIRIKVLKFKKKLILKNELCSLFPHLYAV